jgi:hypothetical protein
LRVESSPEYQNKFAIVLPKRVARSTNLEPLTRKEELKFGHSVWPPRFIDDETSVLIFKNATWVRLNDWNNVPPSFGFAYSHSGIYCKFFSLCITYYWTITVIEQLLLLSLRYCFCYWTVIAILSYYCFWIVSITQLSLSLLLSFYCCCYCYIFIMNFFSLFLALGFTENSSIRE